MLSTTISRGPGKAFIITAIFIALTTIGVTTGMAQARATAQEAPTGIQPAVPCEEIAHQDFTSLPEAPTRVLSTTLIPANNLAPEHCRVTGYIAPQIQFELRLPTNNWNGRYLQLGCGGFCGSTDIDQKLQLEMQLGECIPENLSGFAIGSSNTGHVGGGGDDALWGMNAPQLKVDWGYRSEHAVSIAAKAITTTFYGQEPSYSYFGGCSTGGRQGLMLAQRYPNNFDGILAGSPVNAVPAVVLTLAWSDKANTAPDGTKILTPDKLSVIHQAVLAECDDEDGLVDGSIRDPRACQFDPASLQCPAGIDRPDCLTPVQVETVRKIYAGPRDEQGNRLYPGGYSPGSELGWRLWLFGFAPGGPGLAESLAGNYLRYLAAWDEQLDYSDLRFNRATFERLSQMSPIYDATDPDLRAFRDSGGKVILWHGWNDPSAPPLGTIAYYQAIQDVLGGLEPTQEFARLYMFPGVGHCGGGTGPSRFDLLTPLVDWVEQGTAPTGVIARQERDSQVIRTRPVYPYPEVARYDGTGSIDNAANFVSAPPATRYDDRISWVGEYVSGYQQWCSWQGTELICRPTFAQNRDNP